MGKLHIGACTWKYPSWWAGLVYSSPNPTSYLAEYTPGSRPSL